MSDSLVIVLSLCIVLILWRVLTYKSKSDKAEEKRLQESLEDEFIYDPVTGAKLTLEQAESGHWVAHDNPNRVKSSAEIEQFYQGEEREAQRLINHLKQQGYQFDDFSDAQIAALEATQMLSKYDEWSYAEPYAKNGHFVFFPAVHIHGGRYQDNYHQSQLMFWVKDDRLSGHFYLREKSGFESLSDAFRSDDDIKLRNYESFTVEKPENVLQVIKVLQHFDGVKGLEIEVKDDNLWVKTLRLPQTEDFKKIESVLEAIKGIS
ncbi:hypothetical protein [Flavobacterium sp.]|uniref:hypothetical protein n=1 Tax=Flavobacterium sp. TaxID=239 RepID=UPI0039E2CB4D